MPVHKYFSFGDNSAMPVYICKYDTEKSIACGLYAPFNVVED